MKKTQKPLQYLSRGALLFNGGASTTSTGGGLTNPNTKPCTLRDRLREQDLQPARTCVRERAREGEMTDRERERACENTKRAANYAQHYKTTEYY